MIHQLFHMSDILWEILTESWAVLDCLQEEDFFVAFETRKRSLDRLKKKLLQVVLRLDVISEKVLPRVGKMCLQWLSEANSG